jgi:hypothetical protein
MSMILYLRRVSDDDLEQIKNRLRTSAPPAQNHTTAPGFFQSFFRKRESSSESVVSEQFHVADFFFEDCDDGDLIDFDKAWDALHFMLTGEPWSTTGPLAIMFYEGEQIGTDDGYRARTFYSQRGNELI